MSVVPAISLDQVAIMRGVRVLLDQVSFSIPQGGFCLLTGRSGAGKTSLLRTLYMDLPPVRGSISILGKKVRGLSFAEQAHLRQKLGLVFQEPNFLSSLSVLENIALPLHIQGLEAKKALATAREVLTWMGVELKEGQTIDHLSGGERKRVSIARAIIRSPKILFADEPTAHVDKETGERILTLLQRVQARGTTVIMSTHNEEIQKNMTWDRLHIEAGVCTYHRAAPDKEIRAGEGRYVSSL